MFRASKSPWWISDHLKLFETEHPPCRWMRLSSVLCPRPKDTFHRPITPRRLTPSGGVVIIPGRERHCLGSQGSYRHTRTRSHAPTHTHTPGKSPPDSEVSGRSRWIHRAEAGIVWAGKDFVVCFGLVLAFPIHLIPPTHSWIPPEF